MFPLGEFLIEPPEDLDDGEGGGGDWIGEITSGRGHGSDDSNGTGSIGGTHAGHTSCSFVELG